MSHNIVENNSPEPAAGEPWVAPEVELIDKTLNAENQLGLLGDLVVLS